MQRSWYRRYDSGVPASVAYPDLTLPELFGRTAARYPHSPAVIFYGARLSFREIDDLITRFALSLRDLGVGLGDRVALMLPNCPQAVIAYYAALRAGALVVPTNPLYVPREIAMQTADSGSDTVVVLDWLYPRIRKAAETVPVKRVIVTSLRDFLPPVRRWLYPFQAWLGGRRVQVDKRQSVLDFLTLLQRGPRGDPGTLPALHPDDLALLQYTGGTTGTPKGVMLSHRNLVVNAVQCKVWVPDFQENQEVFLGVIPFFHVYGLSTCQHLAMITGCPMVLLPRFQPVEVLRAIHRYRVTVFSGIPAMFMAISDYPRARRYDLRSLRVCLSGASPLHSEVRERFERLTGVRISEGYGLTEASPVTHCNPLYGDRPHGAIGVPFPDTDCRIMDQHTGLEEMPDGEVGELVVRGPQVMHGYWNKEPETREALRGGWLYTGDLARRDPSGFFFFVDRKKDMIKSRGENVYPREVEEALFRHPAVKDAVVVGLPDARLGEAVKAYVVAAPGRQLSEREVIEHCRQWLARFKVPTMVEFRTELPRNLAGKVLRRLLREEVPAGQRADSHAHSDRDQRMAAALLSRLLGRERP